MIKKDVIEFKKHVKFYKGKIQKDAEAVCCSVEELYNFLDVHIRYRDLCKRWIIKNETYTEHSDYDTKGKKGLFVSVPVAMQLCNRLNTERSIAVAEHLQALLNCNWKDIPKFSEIKKEFDSLMKSYKAMGQRGDAAARSAALKLEELGFEVKKHFPEWFEFNTKTDIYFTIPQMAKILDLKPSIIINMLSDMVIIGNEPNEPLKAIQRTKLYVTNAESETDVKKLHFIPITLLMLEVKNTFGKAWHWDVANLRPRNLKESWLRGSQTFKYLEKQGVDLLENLA